jgi:hypothetical protein
MGVKRFAKASFLHPAIRVSFRFRLKAGADHEWSGLVRRFLSMVRISAVRFGNFPARFVVSPGSVSMS